MPNPHQKQQDHSNQIFPTPKAIQLKREQTTTIMARKNLEAIKKYALKSLYQNLKEINCTCRTVISKLCSKMHHQILFLNLRKILDGSYGAIKFNKQ
jgi:hypothetical protein